MKSKILLFTVIILTSVFRVYSQFSLEGEFRPRFEFRDGYKTLPDTNSIFAAQVSQRTRLTANYTNARLTAKLTLQDVRLWGDEKLKSDVPSTALHEAWVDLNLSKSFSLKLGRQELSYDNERLFSRSGWQQQGTSHDALLIKFRNRDWKVDFAAAFNQYLDTNFTTNYCNDNVKGNYKTLNFIWASKKFGSFNVALLGIADGYQKDKTINTTYLRYTYGPIISYNGKKISVEFRGFYQMGQSQTGKDISAYFGNAELTAKPFKKFSATAGLEYWSGYDFKDSSSKKINSFDVLYGSGHKFNGNMDYITKASDTKNAGLVDGYLYLVYKFTDKASIRADYHYFALQNNYTKKRGTAAIDKYLGSEFDISGKVDFSEDISLNLGYSFMLATKSMQTIKGGSYKEFPSWAFVMVTVKPTLFKSKD
jgi:hypothetical protein